ncbi:SDR family NAD(P)-dependent oxidoreductase [Streptococcus fryi]
MTQRVIVITGGSGGLAQEMVRQLPKTDKLIMLGRHQETLRACYHNLANVDVFGIDLQDNQAISTIVDEIYKRYGQIDVFVNNAGYGEFKAFDQFSFDDTEEMLRVNTLASMHFARLVGIRMKKRGQGHIITIASMAGLMATAKSTVYSASKFAIIGFSNALRLELAGDNVFVTTVNPGPIQTKFFDQADPDGTYVKSISQFMLQPEEVARKIIAVMGKNKRELNMPWLLHLAHKSYTLFPRVSDFLARKVFNYK